MKKLIFLAVLIGIVACASPVFAQKISEKNASEFYYYNIAVEKIYPYRTGYVIQYRKGVNKMARAYIPHEWFTDSGSKGELVTLPPGKNWPSLTVYYKSGEFSHIRLYIHRSKAHETWGNIPLGTNLDEYFKDVESIDIEFQ